MINEIKVKGKLLSRYELV